MNLIALILGLSLFAAAAGCMIAAPLFSRPGSYAAVRVFSAGLLMAGLANTWSQTLALERVNAVREDRISNAALIEKFGTESEKPLARTLRALPLPRPPAPLQLGAGLVGVLVGLIGLVRPRWLMLPNRRRLYDDNQISPGMEPTA